MPDTTFMQGGFTNPPLQAQDGFRAIMQAMSEPGTLHPIAVIHDAPAALPRGLAIAALTLLDVDTLVWLDDRLRRSQTVTQWLGFHTSAPVTDDPGKAHFALISDAWRMPRLEAFAQGSDTYPDRSTTLIIACDTFVSEASLQLSGPGIDGKRRFGFFPRPDDFLTQWQANTAQFPRGVDLILCGPEGVAALPRSTQISEAEVI